MIVRWLLSKSLEETTVLRVLGKDLDEATYFIEAHFAFRHDDITILAKRLVTSTCWTDAFNEGGSDDAVTVTNDRIFHRWSYAA